MKSIKTLALFVFLLMAFASSGQKFRFIKTRNYEGVVELKPYYPEHSNPRTAKYIPDNRSIAMIEKKIKGMIPSLADQYRALNYLSNQECSIKQILKSYKRYYVGFYRFGHCFVDVDFHKKLPDERSPMSPDSILRGNCPYFFLRYDFQKNMLDVICPDDQMIEIDKSPEQLK